jgi:Flp pilus assembly protein TadB
VFEEKEEKEKKKKKKKKKKKRRRKRSDQDDNHSSQPHAKGYDVLEQSLHKTVNVDSGMLCQSVLYLLPTLWVSAFALALHEPTQTKLRFV